MITKPVFTNASPPPVLPTIGGNDIDLTDLTLGLFMSRPSSSPSLYGRERLVEVGTAALGLILTKYLFKLPAILSVEEIEARRSAVMEDETMLMWLDLYPKEKQRFLRQMDPSSDSQRELCAFFVAYIGAIYLSNAHSDALENWIVKLMTLPKEEAVFDSRPAGMLGGSQSAHPPSLLSSPNTRRGNSVSPDIPETVGEVQPSRSPPSGIDILAHHDSLSRRRSLPFPPTASSSSSTQLHPGLPSSSSFSPEQSESQSLSVQTSISSIAGSPPPSPPQVALIHIYETFSQKGIAITFSDAKCEGRATIFDGKCAVWILMKAYCLSLPVNDEVKGRGIGGSKKVAKENAVREA
ncbi:hypothetical protein D9757_011121 [Collybiopsis confluens]|uniref:RNase III domain-containing protein n=1 Tax=Collybiopsis confluens TaxID=2823264 RepID=A0A8H5GXU8_9AGAR|nr:hypothetical protein D9757_011121 [Collybiopsis confluens]